MRRLIYQKKNNSVMNSNPEYLIDLIYKKLKNYNAKEIFLKKENLKLFISSLFKED